MIANDPVLPWLVAGVLALVLVAVLSVLDARDILGRWDDDDDEMR